MQSFEGFWTTKPQSGPKEYIASCSGPFANLARELRSCLSGMLAGNSWEGFVQQLEPELRNQSLQSLNSVDP